MSWQEIERAKKRPACWVTCALWSRERNAAGVRMAVTVSGPLASMVGVEVGGFVRCLAGAGTHEGFLKIMAADVGHAVRPVSPAKLGHVHIVLTDIPDLKRGPVKAARAEFSHDGRELLVTIPDTLRAAARPSAPAAIAPSTPAEPSHAPARSDLVETARPEAPAARKSAMGTLRFQDDPKAVKAHTTGKTIGPAGARPRRTLP